MCVDIRVVARRTLTQDNLELVRLYNGLVNKDYTPPAELVQHLKGMFGEGAFWPGEQVTIPEGTNTVEIRVSTRGNAVYGVGQIIEIADLPIGTRELRIYAEPHSRLSRNNIGNLAGSNDAADRQP